MYQHADVGACTNLMTRIAIEQALNSRMVDACNMMQVNPRPQSEKQCAVAAHSPDLFLQTKCIEVLKMYRSLCGPAAGATNVRVTRALPTLTAA